MSFHCHFIIQLVVHTLGVINLSEIHNVDNIKAKSKWVNTVFNEDIQKSNHFAFGFTTVNIHNILYFSFLLLNGKADLIAFPSTERRVPILSFKI